MEEVNLKDIHSDEIHDIIGRSPAWIVRHGTLIILCLIGLFLICTWFVRYPDIVTVPVTISAITPPARLISSSNGLISELNTKDGERVTKGQIVGIIDNPANTQDMLQLKKLTEQLNTSAKTQQLLNKMMLPPHLQVGDIQADYINLIQCIKNHPEKESDIRHLASLIKVKIATWEKLYVLKSPISGKLVYFNIWSVNQFVKNGELIFIVVPDSKSEKYILRAVIPTYKSRKIKPGLRVLIKLHEYPYQEYGMLEASIQSLTDVSIDSLYTIKLQLRKGLETTRGKKIVVHSEITGTAEIITKDKNVLQNLLETFNISSI